MSSTPSLNPLRLAPCEVGHAVRWCALEVFRRRTTLERNENQDILLCSWLIGDMMCRDHDGTKRAQHLSRIRARELGIEFVDGEVIS